MPYYRPDNFLMFSGKASAPPELNLFCVPAEMDVDIPSLPVVAGLPNGCPTMSMI